MSSVKTDSPTAVAVLCTYNGAKYLPEQLASIAGQTVPIRRLVLRDDGSQDDSVQIVSSWCDANSVELQQVDSRGERLGPARSFLTALGSSTRADAHLLVDQDDVWLPCKVERALQSLHDASDGPVLYATALQVVDFKLCPLRTTAAPRVLSFGNAVCESVLTGCTMALNEPLRRLAARSVPQHAAMHDWWLYLLASATGEVRFDSASTMLYRQHSENVIGAAANGWRGIAARLGRIRSVDEGRRKRQIAEFLDTYGDCIRPEWLQPLRRLVRPGASVLDRIRLALSLPIERQRRRDLVTTRLAIALGHF